MKEFYTSPEVLMEEFDKKDVIITSPEGAVANDDHSGTGGNQDGWSGMH